jgi:hypothetical protein
MQHHVLEPGSGHDADAAAAVTPRRGVDARPRVGTIPVVRTLWRYRWPFLFISPFYVLFCTFALYPILFSVWLSLHQWRGVGSMRWVGRHNYDVLLEDRLF